MSPKCLPEQARRQIIQNNILTHNYDQLAELCRCHKRTIIRTVNNWRQQGGFEDALWEEFRSFYPDIKKKFPEKAFDRLCYLLGKTLTRKAEFTERIEEKKEVTFKLDGLSPDEREFAKRLARKYIKANNPRESASIH